jgi:hypothetical protein
VIHTTRANNAYGLFSFIGKKYADSSCKTSNDGTESRVALASRYTGFEASCVLNADNNTTR